MSAQLVPFAFEDHLVCVYKPNGEPWFVAPDVCKALAIKNSRDAMSRLDDDERGVANADTPGGIQEVTIVSEAGVYRLVFSSRKPEAERFKRWLAHEVLPALRKQGFFGMPERAPDAPIAFPTEDAALSEHMAKLATLKECRMIHGTRAAARLWRRLGMPAVEHSVIQQVDDGRACLVRLLDTVVNEDKQFGDHRRVRHLIDAALNENLDAEAFLRDEWGIRVDKASDGIVVSNNDMKLSGIFFGTPWARGAWRFALRRLPGARPASRERFAGLQQRGTFIPADHLDEPPSLPSAENVVPIK